MNSQRENWKERRQRELRRQLKLLGIVVAVMVLVVVLIVVIVANVNKNKEDTTLPDTTADEISQNDGSIEDSQTGADEVEPPVSEPIAVSPNPLLYLGEEPFQWKLECGEYDLSSIDSEILEWGLGPSRDELNRPYDALNYQEKYGKYQSYFIREDETDKVVYLTFDEGYEYGMTPSILDTLKEKEVRAVFFVTLPFIKENPDLVQRMIDEGHIVGNHTVTHPADGLPSLATLEEQANEITTVHEYMKENYDYEMWLFRYPTGKFSEQSLALVNSLGYASVFWTFAYLDYDVNNQPDEAEALQKLKDKICPGSIMLLHGESQTNANILGEFIDWGRAEGYTFAPFYPVTEETQEEVPDEAAGE